MGLDSQPVDLRVHVLSQYLFETDIASLAATSLLFFKETRNIVYWKKKLLALVADPAVLKSLINTNAINYYGNLHHTLLRLAFASKKPYDGEPWELLCLSGDAAAIHYGIQHQLIDANIKNKHGQHALHLAALSGNVFALEEAIKIKGINQAATDKYGNHVLHLAAWSGSEDAIKTAAKIPGLNPLATNNTGTNILHLAVCSGRESAMRAAQQTRGLNLTKANHLGLNVFHLAVFNKKPSAIIYLRRLTLNLRIEFDINQVDNQGHSPFWYADHCEDISARNELKSALTTKVEALNLPARRNTHGEMSCRIL